MGNITVFDLTIEPGVVVEFPNAYRMEVRGTLLARGTATDSIYFRGLAEPYFKLGGGIWFIAALSGGFRSASVLEYVSIDRMGVFPPNENSEIAALSIAAESTCTIKNSTVRNSTQTGIYVQESYPSPINQDRDGIGPFNKNIHIQNNRFLGNSIDVSVGPSGWGEISGPNRRITIRGGRISKNTTWPALGPNANYEMYGIFEITATLTLTIEPGVRIEPSRGFGAVLEVNGTLIARGTATDSIYLRGENSFPPRLNYVPSLRIIIKPGSTASVLEYVSMDRLGYPDLDPRLDAYNYAISVESECTITNSTVRNSIKTGVFIGDGNVSYSIQNNRYLNNPIDLSVGPSGWEGISLPDAKFAIRGGTLLANSTWRSLSPNNPYQLVGTVEIPAGLTLTIEPGVTINLRNTYDYCIKVYGTLLARGTATDSIRFQGQTNSEGNFTSRGAISILEGSTASVLEYVSIDHVGGYPSAVIVASEFTFKNSIVQNSGAGGIFVSTPDISFSNLTVSNSNRIGFTYEAVGNPTITNSKFFNNKEGGVIVRQGHPTFSGCNIYGNTHPNTTNFGIENYSANTVDARNCYWGTPTGPYHPTLNPSGTGNRVTDKVLFNPWSQTPGGCMPLTVKSGNWNDPTVWLCGQVPGSTDVVVIRHVVVLPGSFTAHAKQVAYEAGGSLDLGANSHIQLGN